VLDEMDHVLARSDRAAGDLGVEVETLTPEVGAVVGVPSGLIVTWVEPSGPAAKALHTGDVIQQIDGQQVSTADDWLLSMARIVEGDEVRLSVLRAGMPHEVDLAAAPVWRPSPPRQAGAKSVTQRLPLGLEMRSETGQGISVRSVGAGSRAEEAGLAVGDLITRAGNLDAPTPAQLRQALARGPVLLAVTRGTRHHVLALQP